MRRPSRRSPLLCAVGIVGVVVGMCGVLLVSPTQAAWTSAKLTNGANSSASGSLAFTHTGTASCASGPSTAGTTTCPGTITPTSPTTAAAAGVTGTDAIKDTGTIPGARLAQTVAAASCGPVKYADGIGTDPLLPRYSTTFQQPDGWGTTSATTLSGGAYAADAAGGGGLSSWSMGVRFKVGSGYTGGGGLISLASSPANTPAASAGPASVWMDSAGRLHFYLTGILGTSISGVTTKAYNDGAWHTAVLSVSSLFLSNASLYVDHAAAVTAAGLAALTGTTGYWHIGWVDLTGISGASGTATLTGSLSGGFVVGASLTAGTVSSLVAASSATAYAAVVTGQSAATHLWMLADPGTTTYTGALPATMASPCGQVDVQLTFTSPAASVAKQSLAAFVAAGAHTVAAPGPGTTQTLTVTLTRDASWNKDVAGLRLYAPLTLTETTSPASSWSLRFTWPSADGAFLA